VLQPTLFTACMLAATQTWAQLEPLSPGNDVPVVPSAAPAAAETAGSLEIGFGSQHLTAGFDNWSDVTVLGRYALGRHVLRAEAASTRRFGENGAFLGLGDTYTFDEDWYGALAVGAGDGAFYLPRIRIDAALNRKLLSDRSLVATLGLGYYHAPDGHTDRALTLGAIYYFKTPWVVEGGVRFNSSNPGAVRTNQQFVAATWGRDKHDLVTGRFTWGGEGYLSISAQTQLVNFRSNEANLGWRHWFTPRTGALLGLTRYSNPLYRRTGVNVGFFYDF
jgi:YaiO family outer membrane protein